MAEEEQMLNDQYVNAFFMENSIQNYAVLKIAVADKELQEIYRPHILAHNFAMSNNKFTNAGFDVFVPRDETVLDFHAKFLNLGIQCEMLFCVKSVARMMDVVTHDEYGISYNTGYYLYPRSSFAKTPLMMANHVGIIDAGYRGSLIAAVRSLHSEYRIEKGTRLFQICHPSLCPVFVVMVPLEELTTTERGANGFGSSGTGTVDSGANTTICTVSVDDVAEDVLQK
jgi:dUTP pyrophosphatase